MHYLTFLSLWLYFVFESTLIIQIMKREPSYFDRFSRWTRQSWSLKLLTIGILILLLLIPSSMIQSIIGERESLNWEVTREVSSKWANSQVVSGPILTIPVVYLYEQGERLVETRRQIHLLPETLEVSGRIDPERLRRGIYEVAVYRSQLQVSGRFALDPQIDPSFLKEVLWEQAFLTIGLSDLRGIEEEVSVNWGGSVLSAEPGSRLR